MSRTDLVRRRTPPAQIWLVFGIVVAATIACMIMGLVAWQEAGQVQSLQAQIETLQRERQMTEDLLLALQSTATVMENRLTTLEANDPAQQLTELQAAGEAASDSEELDSVRVSLVEIQATVDAFQGTLDDLAAKMELPVPTADRNGGHLPTEARLTVARQKQSHNLSCESSAVSMIAQYHGLNISEADVLRAVPLSDNPHLGFRGNVDGPTGGIEDYGVYAGPILTFLNNHGLRAWPVDGGVEGIKAAIVRGNPVIAWVTYDCMPSTAVETVIDGQAVTLVPNQHTVVVTGYNGEGVWANDSYDGQEDFYPFADFQRAMGYFGDMAIEVAAP